MTTMKRNKIIMVCGIGASIGMALWMLDEQIAKWVAGAIIILCLLCAGAFTVGTWVES